MLSSSSRIMRRAVLKRGQGMMIVDLAAMQHPRSVSSLSVLARTMVTRRSALSGITTTNNHTTNPLMTPAFAMLSSSDMTGIHHHQHHHQQQQRRTLFIQTESTPNPESIKFLPGRPVLTTSEGTSDDNYDENNNATTNGFYATRSDKSEIARSPLAKKLFEIDGIKSVYLGIDFVTVTKYAESQWAHIKTRVFGAIMDHYESGKPAVSDVAEITDTTIFEDDDEVVAMIKELLEARIRPAVQEDGGDIRYVGFDAESGIVTVKLAGSCVGCPSSAVTLKNGVENMMMHYVPEVTGVNAIEDDEEGGLAGVEEGNGNDDGPKKNKTYEERLAAAGIPFSD